MVGHADWHKCKKLQRSLFDTSSCPHASCSFGGAYQPALPSTFYGFSYLYDRTAAIGLMDGKMQTYGSATYRISDMERAGEKLCDMEAKDVEERFKVHQDASKSSNFCGDVSYLTTLLLTFGFPESHEMTVTNKIKDVELVWTLGAMLAKSAELANGDHTTVASPPVFGAVLLAAALIFYLVRRRMAAGSGYGRAPLAPGHDSD
jgi:hypothetical protein